MRFWDEKEKKELLQKLPFYDVFTENSNIKHLSNIDLLHEIPFYDELSVVEISKAFKEYPRSYKIESAIKIPLVQFKASKSSTEDLFKDFLHKMKGFTYQITVTVLLRKYKGNGDK